MKEKNNLYPIIIFGMHRSGTTLITHILERLGLFVGKLLDENKEPFFFANLNNWLLRQCGGEWDSPQPIHYLLERPNIMNQTSSRLRFLLATPRIALFVGFFNYLRNSSLLTMSIPWGWKDPRNTFTLPVWLSVFPEARFIHVYRHGVDVASSLRVRSEKMLENSLKRDKELNLSWLRPRLKFTTNSVRCLSLEGGFSLWEEYMYEARKHIQRNNLQIIEMKFEEILNNPCIAIKQMADFCGLKGPTDQVEDILKNLKKERSYNYTTNEELRLFSKTVENRLRIFGY